ncbi:metalloregulator ArsR/SmtB family transcription factor [Paremcibacter congregatus]|uniref:helix-turn-helix transcriptional regulator n=1 Tax=Paremcibacter congregatus TaxID=2043170 RepID=UPI0030EE9A82|tara:strand:- start:5585 stop:6253 length:669 start_codon:yes stop_codon:yes gene_type:complete
MTLKTQKKTAAEKTRARILTLLKQQGPQEAPVLAASLGVTDMAIRQHLYALEEMGDICHCKLARPKGRPAKLWQLTEQAQTHFPNTHADFSTGLISSIKKTFGDQGMEKLLDVRLREQVTDYQTQIDADDPLAEKLAALSDLRSREGYMTDILPGDRKDSFLFVENNCPVCEAARVCSGICARELDLFKSVLGDKVSVNRTEHIIKGARRCAYTVAPKGEED